MSTGYQSRHDENHFNLSSANFIADVLSPLAASPLRGLALSGFTSPTIASPVVRLGVVDGGTTGGLAGIELIG